MDWIASPKQALFLKELLDPNGADEILYGGAVGGGKTDCLLVSAIIWAKCNPKTWVLFLRKTFPELEQKPIPRSKELLEGEPATYNESKHKWTFSNGAVIQFGSMEDSGSEQKYLSSEYSLIIFDELTMFEERQYMFMLTRNRSTTCRWKPRIIGGTNPGNVGHYFVMKRWSIDDQTSWYKRMPVPQDEGEKLKGTIPRTRCFIHSTIEDNQILIKSNPGYVQALKELPEAERQAKINGIWTSMEGQYFTDWNYSIHVIKPFDIPHHWRHFLSLDYGMDMLALYEHVVDQQGKVYTIRELCQPDLNLTAATIAINGFLDPNVKYDYMVASPDLWNRRQETGRSGIEIMNSNGLKVYTVKADDSRVSGWQNMSDYLYLREDEQGGVSPNWQITTDCPELIRCIPQLLRDKLNPDDVSGKPHEITHSPESARYFLKSRPPISRTEKQVRDRQRAYNTATKPLWSKTGY